METITYSGLTFAVRTEDDTDHGAPWDECDGHGVVSQWTTRSKYPGELVLCEDRGQRRFYDFAASMRIAKRDGWGLSDEHKAEMAAKLGREATRGEIVAESVRLDYEYLRRWCNDQWRYVGVIVTLLDVEGEQTSRDASLWGIESDADDYLAEVSRELAQEVAGQVGKRRKTITEGAARIRVRE